MTRDLNTNITHAIGSFLLSSVLDKRGTSGRQSVKDYAYCVVTMFLFIAPSRACTFNQSIFAHQTNLRGHRVNNVHVIGI